LNKISEDANNSADDIHPQYTPSYYDTGEHQLQGGVSNVNYINRFGSGFEILNNQTWELPLKLMHKILIGNKLTTINWQFEGKTTDNAGVTPFIAIQPFKNFSPLGTIVIQASDFGATGVFQAFNGTALLSSYGYVAGDILEISVYLRGDYNENIYVRNIGIFLS